MSPLPVSPPLEPMLARLQPDIPRGDGWVYEPKWDGFRMLAFVDAPSVQLASRTGQPLERYFPEVQDALRSCLPDRCVVDGEIVIAGDDGLDFDALQLRLHPAASRVKLLATEIPASVVLFDMLACGGDDLRDEPLTRRREVLEAVLRPGPACFLTPQTPDPDTAQSWFERFEGAGLDGVIAKRIEVPYTPGERVMVKVKHQRTIDCVVGGYRLNKSKDGIGSLLLGLYQEGVLQYVGFTSSFKAAERRAMLQELGPLEGGPSFGEGRSPGGPSRWNRGTDTSWVSLRPELVCEVAFDHMQGHRFRHGTRFLRWRQDKLPQDCTYDQLTPPQPFSLDEIRALSAHRS